MWFFFLSVWVKIKPFLKQFCSAIQQFFYALVYIEEWQSWLNALVC